MREDLDLRGERSPASTCIDDKRLDLVRTVQCGGRQAVFAHLLSLYLQDSQRLMATLRRAVREGDADILDRTAHRFKSSSATLGAWRLAEFCEKLEEMGRTNSLSDAGSLFEQVEHEYHAVCAAFNEQLAKGSAS